jgi:hypothetical protein
MGQTEIEKPRMKTPEINQQFADDWTKKSWEIMETGRKEGLPHSELFERLKEGFKEIGGELRITDRGIRQTISKIERNWSRRKRNEQQAAKVAIETGTSVETYLQHLAELWDTALTEVETYVSKEEFLQQAGVAWDETKHAVEANAALALQQKQQALTTKESEGFRRLERVDRHQQKRTKQAEAERRQQEYLTSPAGRAAAAAEKANRRATKKAVAELHRQLANLVSGKELVERGVPASKLKRLKPDYVEGGSHHNLAFCRFNPNRADILTLMQSHMHEETKRIDTLTNPQTLGTWSPIWRFNKTNEPRKVA